MQLMQTYAIAQPPNHHLGSCHERLRGPWRGKYNADGTPNAILGHNIRRRCLGHSSSLRFRWFGVNPGSTLAGSDLRIGVIATNTMLAGAAGSIGAML